MSDYFFDFPFADLNDDDFYKLLWCTGKNVLTNNSDFRQYIEKFLENHVMVDSVAGYMTPEEACIAIDKHASATAFSLLHINIRSLNANYMKLQDLLLNLNNKIDVLVLSEIWSTNINFFDSMFSEYNFFYSVPAGQKAGGVGVLVRKIYNARIIHSSSTKNFTSGLAEFLIVQLEYNSSKYFVCAIYRHPGFSIKSFNDVFGSLLNLIKHKKKCIIAGDLNIDLNKCETDMHVSKYVNDLLTLNFMPFSVLPTRINSTSATVIDHIFSNLHNHESMSLRSITLLCDISDHLGNLVLILNNKPRVRYEDRPFIRLFTDSNIHKFCNMLCVNDWHLVYDCLDVNDSVSRFMNDFQSAFEVCFPLVKCSRKQYKSKSWITKALKISIKNKNKLYHKYISTKLMTDKDKYNNYKKILDKLLLKARKDYFAELLNKQTNSIKSIWKTLNEICCFKKSHKNSKINCIISNGKEISSHTEIAESFNNYFSSVGSKLAAQIPTTNNSYKKYLTKPNLHSFYLLSVTEMEVFSVIKSLKNSFSSGADGIPASIIKSCFHCFIGPLTHIINLSFKSGIFPDNFKIAKVLPIHKGGDSIEVNNYRPISLLGNFSKIIEKLIYTRVISFFDKFNLLYANQYGFRKNHSTSDALLNTLNMIQTEKVKKNIVLGLFFDLSKAFDTVNHEILMYKMSYYGIRGVALNWFKSYLSGRKQFVTIGKTDSNLESINIGVPQGSVLGPLLFLIYMNDIQFACNDACIILFADDSNVFVYDKTADKLFIKANHICHNIAQWFGCNLLSLNYDKTSYTIFHANQTINSDISNNNLKIVINNKEICRVTKIKFLGVLLDEKLLFNEHVKYVANKVNSISSMLYKRKELLPMNQRRSIYFSLVYSVISFNCIIYCNTKWCHIYPLHIAVNRVLRTLQNADRLTHVHDLYKKFLTLPLQLLFRFELGKLVYKSLFCKHLICPSTCNLIRYESIQMCHNTRSTGTYYLSKNADVSFYASYCNIAYSIWNSIPITIRTACSLSRFCHDYKLWLMSTLE